MIVIDDNKKIEFKEFALKRSIIDDTRGILSKGCRDMLDHALSCGGYVAGGFANLIARYYVLDMIDYDQFEERVHMHVGSIDRKEHIVLRNANSSDIDVWFPDLGSTSKFKETLSSKSICYIESKSQLGFATEYVIDCAGRLRERVQVIDTMPAPVLEQLPRFDIYNAMVAFDDKKITYAERWPELERAKTLHVATWKSPWTVSRLFKYLRRKGYKKVTPAVATSIAKMATMSIEYAKSQNLITKEMIEECNHNKILKNALLKNNYAIVKLLEPFVSEIAADDLLMLSALCGNANVDSYGNSPLMKELFKRMPDRDNHVSDT